MVVEYKEKQSINKDCKSTLRIDSRIGSHLFTTALVYDFPDERLTAHWTLENLCHNECGSKCWKLVARDSMPANEEESCFRVSEIDLGGDSPRFLSLVTQAYLWKIMWHPVSYNHSFSVFIFVFCARVSNFVCKGNFNALTDRGAFVVGLNLQLK